MDTNSTTIFGELRSKMQYTEAVLLEVQRIGNVTPMALLHSNTQTTYIDDYVLPPDTIINSSMVSILMDPGISIMKTVQQRLSQISYITSTISWQNS